MIKCKIKPEFVTDDMIWEDTDITKKRLFFVLMCISALILSTNGCGSRTKDTLGEIPSPTEKVPQAITKMATPEGLISPTPGVSSDVPEVEGETEETELSYLRKVFSIYPNSNETALFNHFYYLDNQNCLNAFFWEYNTDFDLSYTSCCLYKEQKDGTIADTKITWDSEADKLMNLAEDGDDMVSIMSQWINEENGDFYIIVCRYSFDSGDNPAFLYGIHPDGELFVNILLEDTLVMDKINPDTYACGFTIDYIGQEDGTAYFNYKDDSQRAVVYYDMKNNSITKQVFTGYCVKGIIDDRYVAVDDQQLIIGSIPEGEQTMMANGNTIAIGRSDILHQYDMPEYKAISMNGDYVYILTKDNYQRIIPGDDRWETLADVSEITENIGADLYLMDLIAGDKESFSLIFYEDSGAGYYINGYQKSNQGN